MLLYKGDLCHPAPTYVYVYIYIHGGHLGGSLISIITVLPCSLYTTHHCCLSLLHIVVLTLSTVISPFPPTPTPSLLSSHSLPPSLPSSLPPFLPPSPLLPPLLPPSLPPSLSLSLPPPSLPPPPPLSPSSPPSLPPPLSLSLPRYFFFLFFLLVYGLLLCSQ